MTKLRSRFTYHSSRFTYHFRCLFPILVEHPLNLSSHRVIFHNNAQFAAPIQAYLAKILAADEEAARVNHDTLGVKLVTNKLPHMIVWDYFVIRCVRADYLNVAAGGSFAKQYTDDFLVRQFRIHYPNRPLGGPKQIQHFAAAV